MNLPPQLKTVAMLSMAVALLLTSPPVRAQEETDAPEEKPLGSFTVELEGWVSQPTGLDYTPATQSDATNAIGTRLLQVNHGTKDEARYIVNWELPKRFGRLALSYYNHDEDTPLDGFEPSQFPFGQTLSHGEFAGYANDGQADAFFADTRTGLRDARLELYRPAFRSDKLRGDWFVGWRRVTHRRSINSTYYALVPDLPPLLPPIVPCPGGICPNLDPEPDTALMQSKFEGRGPTLGLDVTLPLIKDAFLFEGTIGVTVMRGDTDAFYSSTTHRYVNPTDGSVVGPPFAEFNLCQGQDGPEPCTDPNATPLALLIEQQTIGTGLQVSSSSSTSQVFEADLGFRWKARGWLHVIGGFRTTHYSDIGVELKPVGDDLLEQQQNPQFDFTVKVEDFVETRRSATYEGFYGGVAIRLY